MDAKKMREVRLRLESEGEQLLRSLSRNRAATEDVKVENTEDEGDLATISHERELLSRLHESDFSRLRLIQQAMRAIDRGEYGACVVCEEDINEKRLAAVPWATTCISCQAAAEAATADSCLVHAGDDEPPTFE